MIVELLRVQCGCGNQLAALFDNHHSAIVAGERAGWLMQSESIGGDQCPRCLGREDNTVDDWKAYDESVAEQWHAYNEAIARGVELWEYAADVTGWYDSALALVDLHEQWEAEALKERDQAHAEVTSLRLRLAEDNDTLRPVMDANEDLREHVNLLKRERDEARAEVERMTAQRDEARRLAEHLRSRADWKLPWDINENDAIDDADELAAYAEASDLRALAEREAVTEGGDDEPGR